MDPLTAVSLAGTIIQFVDFSAKLFSEGKELYRSADGALEENVKIENVTSEFQSICRNLQDKNAPTTTPGTRSIADAHTNALHNLASNCIVESDKLTKLFRGLQVPKDTTHRTWHAIRQSIRAALKKEEIARLRSTLDMFQQQVNTRLLAILSDGQWNMQLDIMDIKQASRRLETDTSTQVEKIREEIVQGLRTQSQNQSRNSQSTLQQVRNLQHEMEKGTNLRRSLRILEGLHFDYLIERESKIKESHGKTFKWIFDETVTTFPRWVESGGGIFWLTGKAGSGKSTLMKYICNNARTQQLIRSWVKSDKVIIAEHFFWVTGKTLEKSQEGLFRSLLYRILKQCPHDIPTVCSRRWEKGEHFDKDDWTISELGEALEKLGDLRDRTKIILFIDGLDEYGDEHRDIIRIVKNMSSSQHIKLCVSSRPWTIFEKAFGSSVNQLLLEDLTRNDIRRYVEDELCQDPTFATLRHTNVDYNDLIEQITAKANGVFLWVFLVVRSLLRGLEKNDGISDLKKRVDELPQDLNEYFMRMLDNIERVYREQTSRMLLVTTYASEPLPVPALSFLELEEQDPRYTIRHKFPYIHEPALKKMVAEWKRKVNNRCTDLLEVHVWNVGDQFMRARVEFLHRSVRDFLLQEDIVKLLLKRVATDFDPRLSLCRIHVALIKSLPMEQGYATQIRTIDKLKNGFI
ncbi:hypothetical protein N0V90_006032 [Kalmusia sp. IMI 367209]|nr:hypothetical protein N0V90_006032 [Kalmusia sp. IMI 367209]